MDSQENFQNFWRSLYPKCAPIVYSLKYELPNKWLRFHSLPNGKRYPQNSDELKEVLFRYNCILKEIMSNVAEVFIVFAFVAAASDIRNQQDYVNKLYKFKDKFSVLYDEAPYIISSKIISFKGSDFNNIFEKIANDEVDNFVIINPKNGDIFAPYDGGVDLIINNAQKLKAMRNKYSNWLSSREDGC